MSRRIFSKLALASLTLALVPFAAQAVATIDQAAPAFTGKGADGRTISLGDYKGKTVVLEWTNHDCPFVKKHYDSGNIPQLQKDAAAKGVVWLQVISSAPGEQGQVDGPTAIKINGYRNSKPAGIVLDADGTIGKLYGAKTTPHLFIINPEGKVVYKGGIDSIPSTNPADIAKADNYVSSALAALAAGKKVAHPSTQPYGCSVKYAS